MSELISFNDFQRLDLRIGTVKEVGDHPNADRLYVLKVDVGGQERQLVAGLKGMIPPEELEGKRITLICNLEPATIRGVESQGMLLAADDGNGAVSFLTPHREIPSGSKVR